MKASAARFSASVPGHQVCNIGFDCFEFFRRVQSRGTLELFGQQCGWKRDISSEAERHKTLDDDPSEIKLAPHVTVPGRTRIGMMIVVPSFSSREPCNKRVVAAYIGRFVSSIAPDMCP